MGEPEMASQQLEPSFGSAEGVGCLYPVQGPMEAGAETGSLLRAAGLFPYTTDYKSDRAQTWRGTSWD